ncbi:hypothetical protein Pan265_07450 [Mucisphaera calidilacus]|uniref:Uncharacterized protein n=2 Tax=Mucisphaera calidilacus TaxID=2527982 RepID=A0A518BV87_9BACT|nr:hypothetical protein Pan265_07450 [Mucisphaera calidilacus]
MNRASQALLERDYLTTESLCEQARDLARSSEAWDDYARILMPLQECRRMRRTIAAEGWLLIGTHDRDALLDDLASQGPPPGPKPFTHPGKQPGEICAAQIVVTAPLTPDDTRIIWETCRQRRLWVELLLAGGSGPSRVARSWGDNNLTAEIPAPPGDIPIDTWIEPRHKHAVTGSTWFQAACETLGNAALTALNTPPATPASLDQIAQAVDAIPDHELLHQRLYEYARLLQRTHTTSDSKTTT